jgi:hypothetical protein
VQRPFSLWCRDARCSQLCFAGAWRVANSVLQPAVPKSMQTVDRFFLARLSDLQEWDTRCSISSTVRSAVIEHGVWYPDALYRYRIATMHCATQTAVWRNPRTYGFTGKKFSRLTYPSYHSPFKARYVLLSSTTTLSSHIAARNSTQRRMLPRINFQVLILMLACYSGCGRYHRL